MQDSSLQNVVKEDAIATTETVDSASNFDYTNGIVIDNKQFGAKLKHAKDFGLDLSDPKDREKFRSIIINIVENREEVIQGLWRGQGEKTDSGNRKDAIVDFIVKGNDIVIALEGKFITILKDGVLNNTRYQSAKRGIKK